MMKKYILAIALLFISHDLMAQAISSAPTPSAAAKTMASTIVNSAHLSAETQGQANTVIKNLNQCIPGVYSFLSSSFDIKGFEKEDCLLMIKAPDESGEITTHHCKLSKNTVSAYVDSLSNFVKNNEPTDQTVLAQNELEKALNKECD